MIGVPTLEVTDIDQLQIMERLKQFNINPAEAGIAVGIDQAVKNLGISVFVNGNYLISATLVLPIQKDYDGAYFFLHKQQAEKLLIILEQFMYKCVSLEGLAYGQSHNAYSVGGVYAIWLTIINSKDIPVNVTSIGRELYLIGFKGTADPRLPGKNKKDQMKQALELAYGLSFGRGKMAENQADATALAINSTIYIALKYNKDTWASLNNEQKKVLFNSKGDGNLQLKDRFYFDNIIWKMGVDGLTWQLEKQQ